MTDLNAVNLLWIIANSLIVVAWCSGRPEGWHAVAGVAAALLFLTTYSDYALVWQLLAAVYAVSMAMIAYSEQQTWNRLRARDGITVTLYRS